MITLCPLFILSCKSRRRYQNNKTSSRVFFIPDKKLRWRQRHVILMKRKNWRFRKVCGEGRVGGGVLSPRSLSFSDINEIIWNTMVTIRLSAKSKKKQQLELGLCISHCHSSGIWKRPTKDLKNQCTVTLLSLIFVFRTPCSCLPWVDVSRCCANDSHIFGHVPCKNG